MVLHASVVTFKNKQPLYNVMASARNLVEHVQKEEIPQNNGGILFSFSDVRGSITDRAILKVPATLRTLIEALELTDKEGINRRELGNILRKKDEELKKAMLAKVAKKYNWSRKFYNDLCNKDDNEHLFLKLLYYLKSQERE